MRIKSYKMKCKICGDNFNTKLMLCNHIIDIHRINLEKYSINFDDTIKITQCKICKRDIPKENTYCSKKCIAADKELMSNKKKTIINDTSKIIECNICNWVSVDINNLSGNLQKHLLRHSIVDNYKSFFTIKDKPDDTRLKLKCPYCDWETIDTDNKSGMIGSHIKKIHNKSISEYVNENPEHKHLWKTYFNKLELAQRVENNKNITCKVCSQRLNRITDVHLSIHGMTRREYDLYGVDEFTLDCTCEICKGRYSINGLHNHIKFTHGMDVEQYKLKYGEYSNIKIENKKELKDGKFECLICKDRFNTHKKLSHHIKSHNISKIEYVKEYILKNEPQYCKCGCGKEVSISWLPPYRNDFISGHNPNPMTGRIHTKRTKDKQRIKAIERICNTNKFNTKIELKFKEWLDVRSINYIQQYSTDFGSIDFYLPEYGYYIEIDGLYWHPSEINNLNFRLLSNVINAYKKDIGIPNLIRINERDIDSIDVMSISDIAHNFTVDMSCGVNIEWDQIIISKEYFKDYIDRYGKKKLESHIYLLLKFIRTFKPSLPIIPKTDSIQDIISKISVYDTSKNLNTDIKSFNNNCSVLGNSYLKSNFLSYWNSSYGKSNSPVEVWNDDYIMKNVIKYRIGCNDSNEVFNFTMHDLVKGISAARFSISFFKPILAKAIYKELLGDNISTPTVFDPCCGFGGRLLGFKSTFPNGTYIGCEPNIDTYNELNNLILDSNFTNCRIYNCKLEDMDSDLEYDVLFTSIPYYNTERYSNGNTYKSFDEWKDIFIGKLLQYKNSYINMSYDICVKLGLESNIKWSISSSKSHFNKNSKVNQEVIVFIE